MLILLGQLDSRPENEEIYRNLLSDGSSEVRAMALERLSELDCLRTEEVLRFLDDSSMKVKRMALMILQSKKIKH